jgi:nitrogen regulatory protein PII
MRFKLIMAFVDPDLTNKLIKTAKDSGATGDVVIQAKGSGIEEAKFLGLPIKDQTDIILLIVEEHHVEKIIESVQKECKIEEPGNGIIISMSIDKVAGLSKQIKKITENLNDQNIDL